MLLSKIILVILGIKWLFVYKVRLFLLRCCFYCVVVFTVAIPVKRCFLLDWKIECLPPLYMWKQLEMLLVGLGTFPDGQHYFVVKTHGLENYPQQFT